MYEKKISPINRKIEITIEIRISKLKVKRSNVVAKKEIEVPDQVFFGLIFGKIRGPLKNLPETYATVSLKKEIKINK